MGVPSQLFRMDPLASFIALFIALFTVVITVYSFPFMRGRKHNGAYYFYVLLTFIASLGAVYANHLVVFIVCWGFLAFLLYLLIGMGDKERASATARKAFLIVGGTDALMIFGLGIVVHLTGQFEMNKISIALNSKPAVLAYLCFAAGAFAKAGAMPFHSWIPDTAEDAPTPVTAFLPASLDKLLGIYFLARISMGMFHMSPAMNTVLMAVGAFTIVAAVMMALIQHDLKRLLGYHAVSQVGYMVLGIGTGNPVGIAGGLFHMLNHAIYKSCLFLSGGSVEKRAGTTDLDKLGGFAKIMPVTFLTFLIASFAISGVPPFNGFVSKWMIYQGILETAKTGGPLWILWLIAAMFGSALTLASFMKLIHSVFLGQPSKDRTVRDGRVQESSPAMLVPMGLLALLCVLFGVFAYRLPLQNYIFPSLGMTVRFSGLWSAGLATGLILIGLLIGTVIYWFGAAMKARETDAFVGGENLEKFPDMRVSGTDFYHTVSEYGPLKPVYGLAEKKYFDPYVIGSKIASAVSGFLRYLHNGVLPTYLAWCLIGVIILFYILLR